jgi:DNA-binding LacI/PurR family transcriptional regulator
MIETRMSSGSRIKLSDVAKQAGVHPATVSHVLANRVEARISPETRARVLEAASALGYAPNMAARALARGRTQTVAVLTFDFLSPYSSLITHLIKNYALRDGYNVVAAMVHRDLGGIGAQVDGVIALDYSPLHPPHPGMGAYVSVGIYAPDDADASLVDFREASRQGMEHLISTGRRKIAYLTGVDPLHAGDPRESTYLGVMREAGLEPEVLEVPFNDRRSGHEGIARLLTRSVPDAVFCRNDSLAQGCLKALAEAGIRTPHDTAVLGCDGAEETEFLSPPLSTLQVPFSSLCLSAWEAFLARLDDPSGPIQRTVHKAAFIQRGSV